MCVYGSPAIDLNYIFALLNRDDNGKIPFDDIVVFYHQEFVAALKSLEFSKPIPSLIDLNVELIRHGKCQVLMMIVYIPMAFISADTSIVGNIMGTDENNDIVSNFKKNLYNIPKCKAILQQELRSFAHKGWL